MKGKRFTEEQIIGARAVFVSDVDRDGDGDVLIARYRGSSTAIACDRIVVPTRGASPWNAGMVPVREPSLGWMLVAGAMVLTELKGRA